MFEYSIINRLMIRTLPAAFFIFMFLPFILAAQDSLKNSIPAVPVSINTLPNPDSVKHSAFSFSAYVDAYAAYYIDSVGRANYQKFPSVSPRSRQAGLNVIMLTAKYSGDKVRVAAAIHYGDIPLSAWSSKYNFIQEANVGLRLCKNLWLDAGFFRTHFGTEALFPKENYTSSISIPTFFEPYYEAGFRLNYTPTSKLSFFVYALNGYGIFEDNNDKKSAGLLITYEVSSKFNFGYSGYYGDDSLHGNHLRLAHNVFFNIKAKKLKITFGGDYVSQQNSSIVNASTASMGSGVFILSYNLPKKFRIYARGEAFKDPDGILSGIFTNINNKLTGLKLWGYTGGIEYKPTDDSYIRLEARSLSAGKKQEIFHHENAASNTNQRFEAMINLGITF